MIRKGDLNDLDAIEKIFTSVQEYEETHEAYTVYPKWRSQVSWDISRERAAP